MKVWVEYFRKNHHKNSSVGNLAIWGCLTSPKQKKQLYIRFLDV